MRRPVASATNWSTARRRTTAPPGGCPEFDADCHGDGFSLDGGHDVLINDTATGNADTGFELDGDGNNVTGCTADNNSSGDGFAVKGHTNLLHQVTANGNGDNGVVFNGGDHNQVDASTANDNTESGFKVAAGGNNRFINNTANNNDDGFNLAPFDLEDDCDSNPGGNYLNGNKTDGNDEGYKVVTAHNSLIGNTATNNGIGFNLESTTTEESSCVDSEGNTVEPDSADDNLLRNNVATNNNTFQDEEDTSSGIKIHDGAVNNSITRNKVSGSGSFDLEDENFLCDANNWGNNIFVTASQPCIH